MNPIYNFRLKAIVALIFVSQTVLKAQTLGTVPTLASTNVSEASQYGVVYELDIPTNANYNTKSAINYAVNNSGITGLNFSRVAYFLQLDNKWVWVSMNKFSNKLTDYGVPYANSNIIWQQVVTGMNVYGSTGSNVTNATNINGNIEIWPDCYSTGLGLNGIGGNPNTYDFNDTRSAGSNCYGSFQVHNYGASQTLFAYNSFMNNNTSDLGIGNNTGSSGHPDWTFQYNANTYTTRKLYIMVNGYSVTAPSPSTQTVCLNGTTTALSVSANTINGTTITGYNWYSNTTNSNTGGILVASHSTSASSDSYTPTATTAGTTYYYAVVSNSAGTSVTSNPAQVVISAYPVATITPTGPTTFCSGSSVQLNASSGSSFLWSNGATSQSITVNSNSYNTVTVTNAAGCSTTSAPVTVTVNILPSATITAGNSTTFCAGGSVQLNASSGSSYLWNTGATSQMITATSSGNYTVKVTDANGCSATSTATTVAVNPLPSPTVSATSTTTFCSGNNVTLNANGGAGNAIKLNGSAQYINVANTANIPIGNSTYTLEAWIKPNGSSTGGIIGWGNWGTTNQVNAFRMNGSAGLDNYWWANDLVVTTPNLADGAWHHVAATFDGSTRTIYVDGILISSDHPGGHNVPNANNIRIGTTNNTEYFNGAIDEVRVWNIGRTQAQIQAAMKTSIAPNSAGLVAYYKLDEGTGSTTTDATANGNNGTLVGSPSWMVPSTAPMIGYSSYAWSNGATASSINVAASGNYTVTVTDINGCVNTSAATTVTVRPVSTSVTNISVCPSALPYSWNGLSFSAAGSQTTHLTNSVGCDSAATLNLTVLAPTTSLTTLGVCTTALPYTWNGNSYTTAGTYTVHLTNAAGCDSAATLVLSILQPSTSTTSFTVCSTALPYSWNGLEYNTAGTYTYHTSNAVGCDSTATLILSIKYPPVVAPVTGILQLGVGQTTQLSDATPGGVWSTSNATIASVSNGLVTGIAGGQVTISYTVTNDCGPTVVSQIINVSVPGICNNLAAGFIINQANQCISTNNYVFTNTTTGGTAPFVYNWDFNDGSHSSQPDPSHVYGSPSDHDISLTVTDKNGCQSGYTLQITVGPTPQVSFKTDFDTYNGKGTTFISTSTTPAGNMTYYWNLGNGTSSTLVNPMVIYQPGSYLVTLVVNTSGGCSDSIKEVVNITNKSTSILGNVAAIQGGANLCIHSTVQLSDATSGGTWTTSDPTVASVSNNGLVTGIAAGTVQISYSVTGINGTNTVNTLLTVNSQTATPVINGAANMCSNTNAFFTSNTAGGVWGTSAIGVAAVSTTGMVTAIGKGTAMITYTVNNGCGTATAQSTVLVTDCSVPPVAGPINGPSTVATGSTITLSDAVTGGTWTASPATIATIDPNTGVLTGITAGNVTIIYTVSNPNGSNSVSANILVTAAITQVPACTLSAKFSVNNAAQCITGNNFIFTDESTGAGSALVYNWDFNDGSYSVLQNPGHVYNAAASHDVTMTVTDANGCTSEYVLQITVGSEPSASFTTDYNTGSGNGTTYLSTSSITEGTLNYNWDLGDGTSSDLSNPTVYYANGDYKVKLVVSGIGSCKDSVTELIKINGLKNTVAASPNPASGFTNISFTSISGQNNAIIKVHDANGKLVIEKTVSTSPAGTLSNISLYVGGLTNGTYYVIILDEDHHKIGSVTIIKS